MYSIQHIANIFSATQIQGLTWSKISSKAGLRSGCSPQHCFISWMHSSGAWSGATVGLHIGGGFFTFLMISDGRRGETKRNSEGASKAWAIFVSKLCFAERHLCVFPYSTSQNDIIYRHGNKRSRCILLIKWR